MNATPSRRWYRFSLRAAFVLVTLACLAAAWTTYQLKWIQARHERLRSLAAVMIDYAAHPNPLIPAKSAPGFLGLFGEEGHGKFRFVKTPFRSKN